MAASLTPREDRILSEARALDRAFAPWGYYVSDSGPDVTLDLCIDDPDGHARMLEQVTPYWPLPDRKGRRHQWALCSLGTATGKLETMILVECPDCRERFPVVQDERGWSCVCPSCVVDAASVEDGQAPDCGTGASAEAAAQQWSELTI